MHRKPIGSGRLTLSDDGQPVSCLMGGRRSYDGGENGFRIGRLSFLSAPNDYLTMFQMIPRSANETDVVITWLVDKDAAADVDADKISWMWDVTTVQDKKITEDNAEGTPPASIGRGLTRRWNRRRRSSSRPTCRRCARWSPVSAKNVRRNGPRRRSSSPRRKPLAVRAGYRSRCLCGTRMGLLPDEAGSSFRADIRNIPLK